MPLRCKSTTEHREVRSSFRFKCGADNSTDEDDPIERIRDFNRRLLAAYADDRIKYGRAAEATRAVMNEGAKSAQSVARTKYWEGVRNGTIERRSKPPNGATRSAKIQTEERMPPIPPMAPPSIPPAAPTYACDPPPMSLPRTVPNNAPSPAPMPEQDSSQLTKAVETLSRLGYEWVPPTTGYWRLKT
jgi:hypothetical protein